jgi:MFS family permease
MSRPLLLAALTAFLMMLGLGVLFPVLPAFTESLGLSEFEAGLLLGSYPAVGVLMSPVWGRLSERIGRRWPIVIGLLGFSAGFVLFGLGSEFSSLLAARLVGGFFSAATLPAIMAYVADITPLEKRSSAMGTIGAAIALGVTFGPALGGSLGSVGLRVPYFVAGGIGLLTAVGVIALLPESRTEESARAEGARRADLRARGFGLRRIGLGLSPYLLYIFLVTTGRLGVDMTVGFLVAHRLDGSVLSIGALLFSMGVIAAAVQGGLVRALSGRVSDRSLLLWGTVGMAVGLVGVGAAHSWTSLYSAGAVLAVGYSLLSPTFNGVFSRAAEGVQGEAQGLSNSAQQLARVVAPLLFLALYQYVDQASPYYVAAGICVLAWGVAWTRLERTPPLLEAQGSAQKL